VLGPLVFGFVSDILNERFAALTIGIFFIVGLFVLQKVIVPPFKELTETE
jgi:MFS-type transporter involved in bile tolerance (Atg22 family)